MFVIVTCRCIHMTKSATRHGPGTLWRNYGDAFIRDVFFIRGHYDALHDSILNTEEVMKREGGN